MRRILLINGPNLNLLGSREPDHYGRDTLAAIEERLKAQAAGRGAALESFQSNAEHELVDRVQALRLQPVDFVILNPGAFTHTSYALHDCLKSVSFPVIEVHISNVHAREEWRRQDLIAPATRGQIVGLGPAGYYYAAIWLCTQATDPVMGEYDEDGGPVEVDPDDVRVDEAPPVVGGDYEG